MNTYNSSTFNLDLSENVAYNSPAFPAYITDGRLSHYPNYSADSHWHEDLEFILILNGTMTYNVNGTLTTLTKGNGIFINSRQLHYGFSNDGNDCHFLCILLHPSLLSSNPDFTRTYVEPFIRNIGCPFLYLDSNVRWQHELLHLLHNLFEAKEKETAPFLIQRHFFHIFELLYLHIAPAKTDTEPDCLNTLKSMVLFIQEQYQNKLSLSDISKSGSCCKSKCSNLFKQYLKDSPIVYLTKYRLKVSCDLLRNTSLSITEIALETGFHSTSYFCETFRNYYDMTPHDYRTKISTTQQ